MVKGEIQTPISSKVRASGNTRALKTEKENDMSMRALWGLLEGFGFAADISNWIKLKFLSRVFKGGSQPSGGETMNNPAEGEKNLQDEQRALLALCFLFGDQLTSVSNEDAFKTIQEIFDHLTTAGRIGAVEKLRKILAFSGTASLTRRPTGEKIDGKDAVEETRRTIPEDGVKIILGLHIMKVQGAQQDVRLVIQQLDQMGILANTRDQVAEQGKKFSKKAQAALQGSNVVAIEAIMKARLNTAQYRTIMINPELQRFRTAWETVPDTSADEKEAAALVYADGLYKVLEQILAARRKKTPFFPAKWSVIWLIVLVICVLTGFLYSWVGALKHF